jgi:hypothetical protein
MVEVGSNAAGTLAAVEKEQITIDALLKEDQAAVGMVGPSTTHRTARAPLLCSQLSTPQLSSELSAGVKNIESRSV